MKIALRFQEFCSNIRISTEWANKISYRYKRITKQLNKQYWNTLSPDSHSFYAGSFGRFTEIYSSDVDVIMQLPISTYHRINKYKKNPQSALLQEVKHSLVGTYPSTKLGADGQVVVIPFDDGMKFELLPAFKNKNGSFTFPDSNKGGHWKMTNPKPEIKAMKSSNDEWNGNLKDLCRMTRAWRDKHNVPIHGLLIDTLALNFMQGWPLRDKSYFYYDLMMRDFFAFLKHQDPTKPYWLAHGSRQRVFRRGIFEHAAARGFKISNSAISCEEQGRNFEAAKRWKELFGSKF